MPVLRSFRRLILPVLLLAIAAPPAFAATPIAPTPGAQVPLHAAFSWTLDPGDNAGPDPSRGVIIATTPDVNPAGRLNNFGPYIGGGVTSTTIAVPAGSYWWQLVYHTQDGTPRYTTPIPFTVVPIVPAVQAPQMGATIPADSPTILTVSPGDAVVSNIYVSRSPSSSPYLVDSSFPLTNVVKDAGGSTTSATLNAPAGKLLAAGTYYFGFTWHYPVDAQTSDTNLTEEPLTVAPVIHKLDVDVTPVATLTTRTLDVAATFTSNVTTGFVHVKLVSGTKTLSSGATRFTIPAARVGGQTSTKPIGVVVPRSVRAGDKLRLDVTVDSTGIQERRSLSAGPITMLPVDLTANPPKLTADGTEPLVRSYRQAKALLLAKGWDAYSSLGWKQGAAFQALVGILHISGDGCNRYVFFFERGAYLGAGPDDCHLHPAGRTGETVQIAYPVYTRDDSLCCPSQGTAIVGFRWNGHRIVTIGHVPPRDHRY